MKTGSSKAVRAACLAASMATAWGVGASPAAGSQYVPPVDITGSVTPTKTLENATLLYGTNTSGLYVAMASLGTLPGGQTTNYQVNTNRDPSYVMGYGYHYVIMGTYTRDDDTTGVSISFADTSGIVGIKDWDALFSVEGDGLTDYTESLIQEYLETNDYQLTSFGYEYHWIIGAPYNQGSSLANFSEATDGGTVTNVTTPEPATWSILAGLLLLRRPRNRPRQQ